MAADVVKGAHGFVSSAEHDHALARDLDQQAIALVRYLVEPADTEPLAVENVARLEREDLRAQVELRRKRRLHFRSLDRFVVGSHAAPQSDPYIAGPGTMGDPSKKRPSRNPASAAGSAVPLTIAAISLPAPGPMPKP